MLDEIRFDGIVGMGHGFRIDIFPISIRMIQYGFINVIHWEKNWYSKEMLHNKRRSVMELFHHQQNTFSSQLEKEK